MQKRASTRFGEPALPHFYVAATQEYTAQRTLLVHTEGDPAGFIPTIRAEVRTLDPDMPLFDVRTLESHVIEGKFAILFKLPTRLVGAFAVIGATLAALGLYGVIAYSVTQRSHEIGLRLALGATSGAIIRLVLTKGVVLAVAGIGLGVLGAIGLTRTFANLLVGISAGDVPTYTVVSLVVLLVALTACYIPARFRAARIDPVNALREE